MQDVLISDVLLQVKIIICNLFFSPRWWKLQWKILPFGRRRFAFSIKWTCVSHCVALMWGFGVVVQIDPDVVEDHGKNPERKKLKLKEVHLTKLLSTKARGNFPRAKQRAAPAEPIPAKTTANVWIVSVWAVHYPVLSCLFKVAVHSYVENLFRSIWGMTQSKAPLAIKYFFDFLDTQAETMKITDPDVRHIWKTNRYGWASRRLIGQ